MSSIGLNTPTPSPRKIICVFHKKNNGEINMLLFLIGFFLDNAHNIYNFHKNNKTGRKVNRRYLIQLSWKIVVSIKELQINSKVLG